MKVYEGVIAIADPDHKLKRLTHWLDDRKV